MVHEVKMLVKTVYDNVAKSNRKEMIKMVTNADGHCIWEPEIMDEDDDDDDDDGDDVQIQEEQGVPAPPDWANMIQSLDITLD